MFAINTTTTLSTPVLQANSPFTNSFLSGTDFQVMGNSGNGNMRGMVQSVANLGCNVTDFAGFTSGRIALVQRGVCNFQQKIENAFSANATAVIIFNSGTPGNTGLFSGTTGYGNGSPIPVLAVNYWLGVALSSYTDLDVSIVVNASLETVWTMNVIAGKKKRNSSKFWR